MPYLECIIFTEVKYETLSIPIPILEGCLVSLFAGLEQWNELWNGLKQNIKKYLFAIAIPGSAMYQLTLPFSGLHSASSLKWLESKTHTYYMASI